MTAQLQSAINKIEALPENEQNALAILLIQELRWEQSFKNTQDELIHLASEALMEYKKGITRPFAPGLLASPNRSTRTGFATPCALAAVNL